MSKARLMSRYLEYLIQGQRKACRELVWTELDKKGVDAETVYRDLLWPAMERIETMFREDRINVCAEHMATRINRALADQMQRELANKEDNGKRIVICCADGESEELGGQMCADLFESRGWDVYFLGGGVPNDEVLSLIGQLRPDVLYIYGVGPQGVPGVRALIDLIREVGVNPTMNVMVSGGVFNRAEGLWKEIHADLFAADAKEGLAVAEAANPRVPEIKIPGAPKKRRRRRRPPLLERAERPGA